ncbi:MAG: hypothetical protein JRN26_02950 [Nitrososphaerota archaeon]|jgi:hypothetical protein|nr:hypothetical protein [Nitrososphaerota archaeon]MDG6935833.1 hypothetical protein [Nitrososphaerota archaeon]MDG6944600.1 hypothetical protein [Nitrososphaerota archaeon]
MRRYSGSLVNVQKAGVILILALFFVSLVPANGQMTGPYGTPQLQLSEGSIANYTPPHNFAFYWVQGQIYAGGSWYYLNSSRVVSNSTTTTQRGGSSSATNTSASSSSYASSSTTTSVTAASQSEIPAPLALYGYATYYSGSGSTVVPLAFSGGKTVNGLQVFYVGDSASFEGSRVRSLLYATIYVIATNPENNETVGVPLQATIAGQNSTSEYIDLYNAIVALPQFNETAFGAYASKPSQSYPALPLEPYYNLMAIVAIIALVPFAFLDFITPDKRADSRSVMIKIVTGVLIILLFPFIYDHIAYMMNTLNQMVIAYPLNYQYYGAKLDYLETMMVLPSTLTAVSLLTTGVLFVGYIVVTVILWIMNYILGTVRILLVAGMIILFPLSVALRDFHYTQKLGRMIEDTLFGLMLATILSASMLGITAYLLQNWNTVDNMFRIAGIQSQWVAISAVLGALLAPTVLAPLVSTVYMASTQVASVAGGVASAVWMGALSGGASGAASGGGLTGLATGSARGYASSLVSLPEAMIKRGTPTSLMHHERQLMKVIGG